MCRNIKPLFNFEPVATTDEIHEASLQYVRKVSGFTKPTLSNVVAFDQAVDEISAITQKLLSKLETNALPKNREMEAEKAKLRNQKRFGIKVGLN